jgi:hypothetical protein
MASTRLYKVYSGATGTNAQKKWTVSVWVKKQKTGSPQTIAGGYRSSNNSYCDLLKFNANGNLKFFSNSDAGNADTFFQTNARYNDVNGWMHIVQNVDTTQSTQSERFKMWVNGEQITSWSSATYPVQNDTLYWGMNTDVEHQIGAINSGEYWDGLMSHFYFIQNETHAPTVFGETDSTTGEWKIKTNVTGVNYTGRSFYIFKDDNSYTDQSGNNNTWTLSGTLTKTEDNPSNVFATLNPLISVGSDSGNAQILSQGNLHVTGNQSSWCHSRGTFGASSGKWYWEVKLNGSTTGNLNIGVSNAGTNMFGGTVQSLSGNTSIYGDGQYNINGSITGSQSPTFSSGDICGVALNMDNNTVSFYKNGTILSWGTDLAISGGTDDVWLPASAVYSTSESLDFNFGNGYFATTQVSSNSGNGYSGTGSLGIFQYQPPTGYTALSTKGLNL